MKVIIAKDHREMSIFAAHFISRRLEIKKNIVLGFATGNTMIDFYSELVKRHREKGLDFSHAVTFNLDEYVGLSPENEKSYAFYMNRNLFDHVNINPSNIHLPDGMPADLVMEASEYEQKIRQAGGITIQMLGIGANGHIAFNEPGSSLSSRTRVKRLSQETRLAYADLFKGTENVPSYVITMGIGTIMDAEFILLLASGRKKASAVYKTVEGSVSSMCPASVLQFHKHAFIIVDRKASSELAVKYETVDEVLKDPYEEYLYEG